MLKCPRCQNSLLPNSAFCANCGFDFRQNASAPPIKNKSNINTVLIVLGGLLGLCVLCGTINALKERLNPKTEVAKTEAMSPTTPNSKKNSNNVSNTSPSGTKNFVPESICSIPKQVAPNTPFAKLGGGLGKNGQTTAIH